MWDGAFWFGKMLLFGDMALFHCAISFRNKVAKKKNEKGCSYILSLALTLKVFLECAKKKKRSRKKQKNVRRRSFSITALIYVFFY